MAYGAALPLAAGCGGDDHGGGNAADGGKDSGEGRGGGDVPADDALNPDCPANAAAKPYDGKYGMKGACCYRTSNTSRLNASADTATLEYRVSYFVTNNHPKSITNPIIANSTIQGSEKEEQHLLFRFVLPRKDGKFVAGEGSATIGPGRYNCDGTYSFYSDTAATASAGLTDKARWSATPVKILFDPTKSAWQEQSHTVWATNVNRRPSYLPYVLSSGDKGLQWEAASQGFNFLEMPPLDGAINCIGERPDDHSWRPGGKTISYERLDLNSTSAITALGNISLSHLLAFGATGMKGDPTYDVLKASRCVPGSSGCQWQKLPESLCPVGDEMNNWGCHVGDANNEDNVPVNCTEEAPSGVLDPDLGATTEGQCCDPLAQNTRGLPACNAYRLVADIVAGAVEITDAPADSLQPNCEKQ